MRFSRLDRITLIALIVGAAVFVVLVADMTYGLSDSACSACHSDHAIALEGGGHASTTCLSCHLDNGVWSVPGFKVGQWTGMYPAQVLRADPEPVRPVSRAACERCHDMGGGQVIESRGLRIDHSACAAAPLRCDSCHGGVAHGEVARWVAQPVMEECVACHESAGAPRDCDDCHDGRLEIDRLSQGPWRVTHGPEWETTHALGNYQSCLTCHDSSYCGRCHGVAVPHAPAFGRVHGGLSQSEDARCDSCHEPASFCDACHGVEMPHPAGYLRAHVSEAQSSQDPRCISCHSQASCVECHVRHIHPGGATGLAPGQGVTAP